MDRIVVTGASGFLARHLIPLLESKFETVPVTRNKTRGAIHVKDYSDTPDGDLVIHLAEGADLSQHSADEDVLRCLRTVKILSQRFRHRLVYASSSLVYKNTGAVKYSVGDPVEPIDSYTTLKLNNEERVASCGGSVVRFSNLYGPGMASSSVMSDILRQIPGAGPLTVRDDTPIRDFLSVDDAANSLLRIVLTGNKGIFNVGAGVGTSIRGLALLALKLEGNGRREVLATSPNQIEARLVLDIEATERSLGWAPASSLHERMQAYFFSKGERFD